ncbi:complement receptor type 1-like [Lingula anatina]|uniref:Complement receptor type 1-like n=1 Tax=Lingula anatina TaxID=7574 RepID=A0A2R2MTB2_LINAN|nr:complement receptor type 1-like [Lingula anatina]|eukprot:XP_023933262.1 complement receptor type 1-like [Lingula anatina]
MSFYFRRLGIDFPQALPCPDLIIDPTGNYNCTGISGTVGDSVTCSCYLGYMYSDNSNIRVLDCTLMTDSPVWSNRLASCGRTTEICSPPTIPTENHVTGNVSGAIVGDVILYVCDPGYAVQAGNAYVTSVSVECVSANNTHELETTTPSSENSSRLPCPELIINETGNYNCTGTNGTVGDLVMCTCYPGYAFNDSSNIRVVNCTWMTGNLVWSNQLTSCEPQPCPNISTVVTPDHHVTYEDSGPVTVGQNITVRCEGGYALSAENHTDTVQTLECGANGPSSAAWCSVVTPCIALPCPLIELTSANHLVMANHSGFLGDRITFECEANYTLPGFVTTLEVNCSWDGLSTSWSQPVPTCVAICAPPMSPKENHVTGNVSRALVGDIILYVCDPGYVVQTGGVYATSVPVECVSVNSTPSSGDLPSDSAVWESAPPMLPMSSNHHFELEPRPCERQLEYVKGWRSSRRLL